MANPPDRTWDIPQSLPSPAVVPPAPTFSPGAAIHNPYKWPIPVSGSGPFPPPTPDNHPWGAGTPEPPEPPVITELTIVSPTGILSVVSGAPITPIQAVAAGGTPPYTWNQQQGSVYMGLSISPSGLITGTPTTVSTWPYSLRVVDSEGTAVTTSNLQLRIWSGSGPLSFVTPTGPLIPGNVGVYYSSNNIVVTATPPRPTGYYSWFVTAGAPWAAATPASGQPGFTGMVVGVPDTEGTFDVTVTVADATQLNSTTLTTRADRVFSLTIGPAPPLSLDDMGQGSEPVMLVIASQNNWYGFTFVATGGVPPFSWSTDYANPPWFNPVNWGEQSSYWYWDGTPTEYDVATSYFTITVSDSTGATASLQFSLEVQ